MADIGPRDVHLQGCLPDKGTTFCLFIRALSPPCGTYYNTKTHCSTTAPSPPTHHIPTHSSTLTPTHHPGRHPRHVYVDTQWAHHGYKWGLGGHMMCSSCGLGHLHLLACSSGLTHSVDLPPFHKGPKAFKPKQAMPCLAGFRVQGNKPRGIVDCGLC